MNRPFLSPQDKSFATALLHMQCWCWGCDIRNASGNFLLKMGFHQVQPPKDTRGSTCYSITMEADKTVLLWGFGVAILETTGPRNSTGVYLNRYRFEPSFIKAPQDSVHAPIQLVHLEQLKKKRWPDAICLLEQLTDWIASYEEVVKEEFGDKYRASCLSRIPEPELCLLVDVSEAWRAISADLAHLSSHLLLE